MFECQNQVLYDKSDEKNEAVSKFCLLIANHVVSFSVACLSLVKNAT